MAEEIFDFDPAEMLDSDEAIEAFIIEALQTGDAKFIASALGVVARAKGMSKIARKTGLSREHLYKALSENGNPTLETTLAVMKAIGLELTTKHHAV
ncbi:putative addiction module antidote protein [Rhizobium leguminosarum]|uniref:Addiction module antidote protein n=1 Tax=Rhizobium leguminosarum TaxID=384 RepID=A0AAJ1AE52_RHILE|nr:MULTISPECIES: addiction module antidote protein [Rhizobium]MBY3119781.1 putative addiction module antidote protein [Rhizobium laguerreae]MBY3170683.1 putative addiction module antidote protein [Rhizobium laguerreae]MBY3191751.1 putative addiction module antidote protein [Rhizobium laguerreae]MBY3210826.1 putative addiction module antidote protein [Rhizobium laguerreae]MBY5537175.1 putative addiction module antidote protein [Rhizobium leguminosarum]